MSLRFQSQLQVDNIADTQLDNQFEERFKRQISYITFEELKTLFEKWSYEKACHYTQNVVDEMDTYIH